MSAFLIQKRRMLDNNHELRNALIDCSKEFAEIFQFDCIGYSRFYFDGARLAICNDVPFLNQFGTLGIEADVKSFSDYYKQFKHALPDKIYTNQWPISPSNPTLNVAQHLGYQCGFNFYIRKSDYIAAFNFATRSLDPMLNEFYWSNMRIIHEFIFFLQKKMEYFTRHRIGVYDIKSVIKASDLPFSHRVAPDENEFRLQLFRQRLLRNNLGSNALMHFQANLSAREQQCLSLMMRGYSTKEVAQQLALSPRTIETHLSNLKSKTGARNKPDLIKLVNDNRASAVRG